MKMNYEDKFHKAEDTLTIGKTRDKRFLERLKIIKIIKTLAASQLV